MRPETGIPCDLTLHEIPATGAEFRGEFYGPRFSADGASSTSKLVVWIGGLGFYPMVLVEGKREAPS